MKGYVKIPAKDFEKMVVKYDNLKQDFAHLAIDFKRIHEKSKEDREYIDNLARANKFTEDFLESVNPKLVNEWKSYIELREEAEKDAQ